MMEYLEGRRKAIDTKNFMSNDNLDQLRNKRMKLYIVIIIIINIIITIYYLLV